MDLIKENIRNAAFELGFTSVGFAKAGFLPAESTRLSQWLQEGRHGKMEYMENHFDKRTDPTLLHPGTKTIIVLTYNYFQPKNKIPPSDLKIAMYAYGEDYHKVIKNKIKLLIEKLNGNISTGIKPRYFTDSAPILERDWAKYAGLGWIGKNTLLIHPKRGSFFFLAEILTDLEIESDIEIRDHCGSCTKCIEACPTEAISTEGYKLDASKCISYLTIELKEKNIPFQFKGKMEGWIFGCDICQEVCPWNRFSTETQEQKFEPNEDLLHLIKNNWSGLNDEIFNQTFKHSAVKRTGYKNLTRNINLARGLDQVEE